jgi:hypothetical protein
MLVGRSRVRVAELTIYCQSRAALLSAYLAYRGKAGRRKLKMAVEVVTAVP